MRAWKLVLIILAGSLVLGAIVLDRWARPLDLAKERAAARAAGIPLTPADMPLPHYPPAVDAAPDWKAALPLLKAMDESEQWKAVGEAAGHNGTLPPSAMADLHRLLAAHSGAVAAVHRAASKPHRTVSRGWGPDVLFPEFARMRTATRLIRWESLAMAREGRPMDAVRNQTLGLRIARQCDEDPILIALLVSMACEGITEAGYADILRESPPSVALSEAVKRAVAEEAPQYDLVRSLKAETLGGLSSIPLISTPAAARALVAGQTPRAAARPSAFMRRYFRDPNEAVYLHYMTRQVRIAEMPRSQRAAALRALERDMQPSLRKGPAHAVAAILSPVVAKATDRIDEQMTGRAVLAAGADVLAWRAVHGAFPARLAGATKFTTEPATGRALGYRPQKGGFVVYSVGENGFDGRPGAAAKRAVYFSYPQPSLYSPQAGPLGRPHAGPGRL